MRLSRGRARTSAGGSASSCRHRRCTLGFPSAAHRSDRWALLEPTRTDQSSRWAARPRARSDRDFFELDLRAVVDAEAEVRRGLDVPRLAADFGQGLELEVGAVLLDDLPADRVDRDRIGRRRRRPRGASRTRGACRAGRRRP